MVSICASMVPISSLPDDSTLKVRLLAAMAEAAALTRRNPPTMRASSSRPMSEAGKPSTKVAKANTISPIS